MKKYLFLLFLLFLYFVISINKTDLVYLPDDFESDAVANFVLEFDNGINCYDLRKILSNYPNEYYVNNMRFNNKNFEVACDNYQSCLEQIFSVNDEAFYNKYITNGFAVENINIIAYKDEIIPFLNKLNIRYKVI